MVIDYFLARLDPDAFLVDIIGSDHMLLHFMHAQLIDLELFLPYVDLLFVHLAHRAFLQEIYLGLG